MDDRLIVQDSVDHGVVRLLVHRYVGVVITLFDCSVIVDHRVINDWGRMVIVDDGGAIDVGRSDLSVIVHIVEIVLLDHDGMVYVGIIPDVDVDLGNGDVVYDHCMRASPGAVAEVRLAQCQRHPSYISSSVNP
jgi:hypothetical protein